MTKYKIGDRVIVISPHVTNVFGKRGTVGQRHGLFSNVYYVKFDDCNNLDEYGNIILHIHTPNCYLYSHEIELDKQYYREEKLLSLLEKME